MLISEQRQFYIVSWYKYGPNLLQHVFFLPCWRDILLLSLQHLHYIHILCSVCTLVLVISFYPLLPHYYASCPLSLLAITLFSPSPSVGLSLCFSILQLLNQYPPQWNLKHCCEWSNPRVSLSVRNLTGRQKEMRPEKTQQIPAWGELRLASCPLNCVWVRRERNGSTADSSRTSVLQYHAVMCPWETQHVLELNCK